MKILLLVLFLSGCATPPRTIAEHLEAICPADDDCEAAPDTDVRKFFKGYGL